jgi:hypothetical protein
LLAGLYRSGTRGTNGSNCGRRVCTALDHEKRRYGPGPSETASAMQQHALASFKTGMQQRRKRAPIRHRRRARHAYVPDRQVMPCKSRRPHRRA